MKRLSALILVAAALCAQGEEVARFYPMREAEMAAALARIHPKTRSLSERAAAISAAFLGTPYALGPLGEGPSGEFDRGPLVNFKAVDCTTFVEQVMALSLEPDLGKAVKLLQNRYKKGKIRYETRNHFPEADWIPNNVAAGFLKDITRAVAGDKVKTASKVIKKRAWYEAKKLGDLRGFDGEDPAKRAERLERWRALGKRFKDEGVTLDYLPMDSLPTLADSIPSGTIANLVRADKEDAPVLISHQVFIIEKGGFRYVRHAAAGKAVEDVPLIAYFFRYFNSKWPLLGLNLVEIRKP